MPTPSPSIIQLLSVFRQATTAPVFARMVTLICGAILAPRERTVTACLRAAGLSDASDYSAYHRVFSRARWSALWMSRLLLDLLARAFLAPGEPLILIVDDTLERRSGKRIRWRGWFHDAARSTGRQVVCSEGIRWLVVALLVQTPWCKRPWALPFLSVPLLSEKRCVELGRKHRPQTEWAALLVERIRRWQPERPIIVLADGGYASTRMVAACQELSQASSGGPSVVLVSKLRMDAVLHAPAPAVQPGRRGPRPRKGKRLQSLKERAERAERAQERDQDAQTCWTDVAVSWYQGGQVSVRMHTDTALWCRNGTRPVDIRFVLLQCPDPRYAATALFCSDENLSAQQILALYLLRWNIEVTFEEMRSSLGFETGRHFSDRAVGRVTPCLFGLMSLVTLMARLLHPEQLPVQATRWYKKEEPTFRDALAAVRMHLWGAEMYGKLQHSPEHPGMCLFPIALLRTLQRVVCQAG